MEKNCQGSIAAKTRIGYGMPFGRQFGDPAEDDRENHHGEERSEQRPDDADGGLLVADEDVAPGEEVEELAVAPQVAPVVLLRPAGFDDERMCVGHTRLSVTCSPFLGCMNRV